MLHQSLIVTEQATKILRRPVYKPEVVVHQGGPIDVAAVAVERHLASWRCTRMRHIFQAVSNRDFMRIGGSSESFGPCSEVLCHEVWPPH